MNFASKIVWLGCLVSFACHASSVIQVKRPLRMSNSEPLAPKDYFIDMGRREGVRIGDVFEIFRQVSVIDAQGGGDWQLVKVKLGEVKVLFLGESTSLAQKDDSRGPAALPAIDYKNFMVGDEAQLKTSLPFQ